MQEKQKHFYIINQVEGLNKEKSWEAWECYSFKKTKTNYTSRGKNVKLLAKKTNNPHLISKIPLHNIRLLK